jgi:quinol monooxygenase YgiN
MGIPVIIEYYAQEGHEEQLAVLLASHWYHLHAEGLTTEQPAFLMRDPYDPAFFIEVFEWRDERCAESALESPRIQELWDTIQACCEDPIEPERYEAVVAIQAGGG